MLSLSPSASLHAENAPQTVSRAPLAPIVNRETPRNLSAIPPSVRCLPPSLQVVALCDMLADARAEFERSQKHVKRLERYVPQPDLLMILSQF